MYWIPDVFNKLMFDMPLKMAGVDFKSDYGRHMNRDSGFYAETILCQVPGLKGIAEPFCSVNQHEDPAIVEAFGTRTPDSSHYLLHAAPVEKSPRRVPVMLVHGAALNGNTWTVDFEEEGKGLARYLAEQGFQVFAVTFSHPHGDNRIQAVQLADAVRRVLERTGQPELDVVCHSKGGIAFRTWVQGLSKASYQGEVRRALFLGVPNLGTDQVFRRPSQAIMNHYLGFSGVIPYDMMWNMGIVVDTAEQSIYHDGTFRGQAQMLYDWAKTIPLDPLEVDAEIAYQGGWGMLGHSRGFAAALKDGGHFMDKLEKSSFPQDIEVALLAGTRHYIGTIPAETSAPSDGLVFTASALHDSVFRRAGCRILAEDEIVVNHLELFYDQNANEWVLKCLTGS